VASDGLPARVSGSWIETKHHYLDRYCGIFSKGMKNRWPKRVFIDVMAGPGLCKIRDTGSELDGSPLIALNHPFTDFVFVESDPSLCEALKKRVARHAKGQSVIAICSDWQNAVDRGALEALRGRRVPLARKALIGRCAKWPWPRLIRSLTWMILGRP
jgi:three-Cys-motif partner protein